MARLNSAFENLAGNYLFAEVARKVAAHKAAHPGADVISLGIGDVSQPLAPSVVAALHAAVDDMGRAETFKGYGPYQGYDFLRESILAHDFAPLGAELDPDDVFVSDGAKCDVGNIQELFDRQAVVALADPVYPVYLDSNIMAGRDDVIYLPCTLENDFVPELPRRRPDIIYLCYPNNPTGTVLTREQLARWVDYAREHEAVILYDAAYEAFIASPDIPHSIYEIPGAKDVAVEFRSYSKKAGFTGLRCAYAVIPAQLTGRGRNGGKLRVRDLWLRRQESKYNGCPYIVQKAAAAVHTEQAQAEIRATLDIYRGNARLIREACLGLGLTVAGGEHSPYVWVKTPDEALSWSFFDLMLTRGNLVCTPGVGFGASGEGYVRFTAFASSANTARAVERIRNVLG